VHALARAFGIAGALIGALALALSAWAAHGAALDASSGRRVAIALGVLFVHALALLVLAALAHMRRGLLLALTGFGFFAGTALFAGSLLATALLGWRPLLAPAGGIALIVSWLLLATWFAGARAQPRT